MIIVIGSMEPEICRKMLRHLCEKLGTKFPVATLGSGSIERLRPRANVESLSNVIRRTYLF